MGSIGLRAAFERDVDAALARVAPVRTVVEADLAPLPDPVRRYLRVAGVVGHPHVANVHARMHGRIRGSRDAGWISLIAEQYNILSPPARFFYVRGSMFAIPVRGYHRYVDNAAAMTVKAAGLVTVVDAAGDEMTASETVTLFNDMCVIAPAMLVDAPVAWEPVDDRTTRARLSNGGHTIGATLSFAASGELVNFRSDDRRQISSDRRSARRLGWSTPLAAYRPFGSVRLASGGEARWHEPNGDYAYIELTFDEVRYNVRSR
jgi:hypothetical protein